MISFRYKIVPALAGGALALCLAGPAAAIDLGIDASLGGVSANSDTSLDSGGLDSSTDVSLGGVSADSDTSLGGNGLNSSTTASLGGLDADADASIGDDGNSADLCVGTDCATGTGDPGGAGGAGGIIGGAFNGILQNMSEAELLRYKKTCRSILADPSGFDVDLVELCKALASAG